MQAVEFETQLGNGLIQLPLIYSDWCNRYVKVILLQDEMTKTSKKDAWNEVLMFQSTLKQSNRHFTDSTQLIREERDQ
jgi:hypothetical protein